MATGIIFTLDTGDLESVSTLLSNGAMTDAFLNAVAAINSTRLDAMMAESKSLPISDLDTVLADLRHVGEVIDLEWRDVYAERLEQIEADIVFQRLRAKNGEFAFS